jgi:pimeloyl-ACP methyl ester carboxylesterase
MVENAGVEYVADTTPAAELQRFYERGHCPLLEEPDQFNQVMSSSIQDRCR